MELRKELHGFAVIEELGTDSGVSIYMVFNHVRKCYVIYYPLIQFTNDGKVLWFDYIYGHEFSTTEECREYFDYTY
jgi:hypothetical protein